MSGIVEERWDDWANRQTADPESGVSQLMRSGLSRDMAFLVIMLARIHSQLLDVETALKLPPDGEDWRG